MSARWRYSVVIAAILALLSLYPQFSLIYHRGSEYNGAAFVNDNDESEYLAYTQSLADGRPRKNNIYSGGSGERPETFLSIQALPAYVAALPPLVLGITAQSFFPILYVLCAVFAALMLFWFFREITGDDGFAAAAALFVLVLGASAAGYGAVKYYAGLGPSNSALPFLRRYTPGIAFPFLFLFMGHVWRAYDNNSDGRNRNWILASISFTILLYSYLYLWTTALAWVALTVLLTLIFKAGNLARWKFWIRFAAASLILAIPYIWLLSQRFSSTDTVQLLEFTRSPVFGRPPIWIGIGVIAALIFIKVFRLVRVDGRESVMISACALLPLAVFDEHVLTGYSLQPFHYNLYTAPYIALVGAVLLFWVCIRGRSVGVPSWAAPAIIVLTGCWGIVEAHHATRYRLAANLHRDAILPVAAKLREMALGDLHRSSEQVTFNSDLFQADHQPSTAPHGVLWSEHLPWGASISEGAARRRYLLHLYYSNWDVARLRDALRTCPLGLECKALWGNRVIPTVAIGNHAPSPHEIESVIAEFGKLIEEIEVSGPQDPIPDLAVIRSEGFDTATIDRWFDRVRIAEVGDYVIYKLDRRSN